MPKLTKKHILATAKAACIEAEQDRQRGRYVAGTCLYLHRNEPGKDGAAREWVAVLMREYFQPRRDDKERAREERNAVLYEGNWMNEQTCGDGGMGNSLSLEVLAHQRLTLLALFYSAVEAGIINPEEA